MRRPVHQEVLARQPEPIQTFLLQTSILDRLCGPLCDVVIGELELGAWSLETDSQIMANLQPSRSAQEGSPVTRLKGQRILRYLEQANLFLIPLDGERRWYRYHHLFASFLRAHLRQRVDEAGLVTLHLRACQWYADNDLTAEAVSHALAAGDTEQAARLIEVILLPLLTHGEVTSLLGRLARLPEITIRTMPRLTLGKAWALIIMSTIYDIESLLRDDENS